MRWTAAAGSGELFPTKDAADDRDTLNLRGWRIALLAQLPVSALPTNASFIGSLKVLPLGYSLVTKVLLTDQFSSFSEEKQSLSNQRPVPLFSALQGRSATCRTYLWDEDQEGRKGTQLECFRLLPEQSL
jgi:hypothetical protein